jgi:hypothetical protein
MKSEMQIEKMKKTEIEKEYGYLLKGASKFEKVVILFLTRAFYVLHSKPFLFIFYGLFTYPIATLFYLSGANKIIFGVTALIHFATLEISCRFWPERVQEMAYLKEVILFIKLYKETEEN